jgi:ATP-dependent Clp protease ATP-binding subunit ClpB
VEIQLRNLRKRLAERKMNLQLTEGAKEILAKEGFDPVYGARPLKRAIQRLIQDPLALKVLEGAFTEGDLIEIDASAGKGFTFQKNTSKGKNRGRAAHA